MKYNIEDEFELLNCEISSKKLIKITAVIDIKEFYRWLLK